MFANDTELYNSTPRSSTDSLSATCKTVWAMKWTMHNKLQLNEDKTEALLFDPSKSSDLPDVLRIVQSDIPFCYYACDLGVMFDSGLTMKQQVDKICQTAYFEIRKIGSIVSSLLLRPQKFLPHLLSCLV